jgi:prepilin-type N-terminal cleavage/methylation domain-containing protein
MSSRNASGFSLAEVVVTLALAGLLMATTSFAWASYQRKTSLVASVNAMRMALHQARLQAIFQNINHFVVVDPDEHQIRIYKDDDAPLGEFDDGDSLYSTTNWSPVIELMPPASTGSMPHPLGGASLDEGWTDDDVIALMLNPMGKIMNTEATPQIVDVAVIIFNDARGDNGTACISAQGQSGLLSRHKLKESTWVAY